MFYSIGIQTGKFVWHASRVGDGKHSFSTRREFSMEYVVYVGGGFLVLVILFLILVVTRPASFRVERSKMVSGKPSDAFTIINDLRQWRRWSPYDKRDPNMKVELDGPESGVGSSYTWNGNGQVGEGKMTITESKPGELVAMRLQFSRPFKCDNRVRFTMAPEQGGTRVAWIMEGENNFISKAISLFMSMDKMVGKDFEEGLANLDRVVKEDAGKSG